MYDSIIIGGGAAGLSAALVLGRARRRVLLVDAGEPSNRFADGIGGLLGSDRRPPADFYAAARRELEAYPGVEVRPGTAGRAERRDDGFAIDGEATHTVLLATGMDYRFPDIPGAAERWGGSVFHCPFCHGWEHRERPLAVYRSPEKAALLRAWSDDVTEVTDVAAVTDGALLLDDGTEIPCEGLLVPVTLHRRDDLADQLGLATAEPSHLTDEAVQANAMGMTSVEGVLAAGDVTGEMPSVANAVAAGSRAAAGVVQRLISANVIGTPRASSPSVSR